MRFILLNLPLYLFLSPTFAQKENIGVSISFSGSSPIETEPGQVLTTVFLVTTITDQKQEFSEEVELPEGWILITSGFPFELEAGESDTRIVSFSVPLATLAGRYQVIYSVKNSEDANITAEQAIDVVVLSIARLEMMLQEAPQYVIAGRKYQCDFVIVNHSNAGSRIALEIDSKEGYPAKTDSMEFHLEPGESKKVTIIVNTDQNLRKKIDHRLTVIAKALDFEKGEITANASSQVEIIPRMTGVEERYHKIPTQLETRWVGDVRSTQQQLRFMEDIGLQIQLSGSGTLTENGTQKIDFLIRGPDVQKKSILGRQSEYRLSLDTDTWKIHLGERGYSLSPLTEQYRYGWGAEGVLNLPGVRKFNFRRNPPLAPPKEGKKSKASVSEANTHLLSIGAHYVETRWRPKEKQSGIRLSYSPFTKGGRGDYQIWEKWNIGLHYLHKNNPPEGLSRELANDDILSIQTLVEPVKNIGLEFEYGVGWKKRGNLKYIDDAWRIEAKGNYRGVYCQLKTIHASPNYPGYYSDLDYRMGNITFPLWRTLRLQMNYSRQTRNLNLIPTLWAASQERNYGLNINYRFKIGTGLSLDYRNSQREDRLFPPRFNYEQNDIRLSLSQNFKMLSLYASADLGENYDELSHKTQVTGRYRVSANYALTDRQRYSVYFQSERRSFVSTQNRPKTMGLSAWYKPTDRTFIDVNFQRTGFSLMLLRIGDW